MDRCGEQKDRQLRDYFLNRLTPEEVEDFQFHLFHCETCRMNLERMRLLAHDCRDEATSAFDAEMSNAKERRLTFSAFTRVAAVACIVVALGVGGYYFRISHPDGGLPLEMDEPPVLHSGDSVDSVGAGMDSTAVKLDGKGDGDGVE